MRKQIASILMASLSSLPSARAAAPTPFRPPAVPLVAHDPYFSIWSDADHLTDDVTRHWTGVPMTLTGLIRVDGQAMRVIGNAPADRPAMMQTSTTVTPTRTICTFESASIKLKLTFLTPALPDDIALLSTPITYVIWEVASADAKSHEVSAFFSAGADLAYNDKSQAVALVAAKPDAKIIKLGTTQQPVLRRTGDHVRIDWGYACLGGGSEGVTLAASKDGSAASSFAKNGDVASRVENGAPTTSTTTSATTSNTTSPTLGELLNFGSVGSSVVSRHVLIGYDDDKSIEYMGEPLNGFWKRDGTTIEKAFDRFERDLDSIHKRCVDFDERLTKALTDVGGEKYATLANLAYRQSFAGSKIAADRNGMPLFFPKENTSNGCIATADVFFPQIPLLLLLNNDLAKGAVVPILDYAASPRWKFAFAPHDLGTYPQANGQVYGGGEKTEENQMPVEESGNLLLICGAISRVDGNADFAAKYWPELTKWAEYCERDGIDPGRQLCTDDFAGHLARNANLSIKAILGMASFGMMAELKGDHELATHYRSAADAAVKHWMELADAGDHYTLTFDHKDTWSQKYNLVWDDILHLGVFPPTVKQKELAFYKTKLLPLGLPLDSRKNFTKTDWCVWTATLADDRATFSAIVDPIYAMATTTESRVPFSDFYWADSGKDSGMHARPVIGGVFMPMLKDEKVWTKWVKSAEPLSGAWAAFPTK